jgi:hypothetical protein
LAYERLAAATAAGDAAALYHLLDDVTQNSVESAYGYEHQMAGLVASSYRPGPDRDQALRTLADAVDTTSGAELFVADAAHDDPFTGLAATQEPLGHVEQLPPDAGDSRARAQVITGSGAAFSFVQNPNGTWGYAGLADAWHARVIRDSHDMATVTENARLLGGGAPSTPSPAAGGNP